MNGSRALKEGSCRIPHEQTAQTFVSRANPSIGIAYFLKTVVR